METSRGPSPDLPLEKQAKTSVSLALRLHAEGRTEEANVVLDTLGKQMREAGPVAFIIEGSAPSEEFKDMVEKIQNCAERLSDSGLNGGDDVSEIDGSI